jgi:4-hydroxy-tetrahydrodipicolinate reductase
MKIILLGYGKMGRTIEQIALDRGHDISARIDIGNQEELATAKGDVAIEFSHPSAAFDNVRAMLEREIPVVCGTTGWLERKSEIETLCKHTDGAFFYASNYSLGVNIFFRLNEYLSRVMQTFPEYEVELDEVHHVQKKDSPSGTAISLANGILKNISRKKKWVNGQSDLPSDLVIKSFRIADIPGTHVVKYNSPIDDIEIKHTAHSREGFATGAVLVAEWIRNKKGVLSMDDFLKF